LKSSRSIAPAYFDLRGLSAYTGGGLSIRTLRKVLTLPDGLPHFRVGGKILVSRDDFDSWLKRFRQKPLDLDAIVQEILKDL
jgi:hypothetical protein